MEEQTAKVYVVRTHCYGRRPHDSYAVTLADGSTAETEEPSLGSLLAAMDGDKYYLAKDDILEVMDALRTAAGNGQTDEDRLAFAKEMVLRNITAHDASSSVNSFTLNGASVWLDKATRVGLMNSTTIAKSMGSGATTLWLGEAKLEVECDKAIQLLSALEMYALECFNVTAAHKKAVSGLESVEEVLAYDFTEGYPGRLEMTV